MQRLAVCLFALGLFGVGLLACGPAEPPDEDVDAASTTGDGGPRSCAADLECDDGTFCNGAERCAPSSPSADSRGCVAALTPCLDGQVCEEGARVCRTLCSVDEDADGDGVRARECGGSDCDDSNASRFPGAVEVCDAAGLDEDCDPFTIGAQDMDTDGAIDAMCCNRIEGATAICGTDCDDGDASVRPGSVEICDEVDQDCDAAIDEGVRRTFFPDTDMDGWGDRAGTPLQACEVPDGYVENTLDCDDARSSVSPSGTEVCNTVDDDCDGAVDEPDAVAVACASTFGSPPNTMWACVTGACETACGSAYGDCDMEPSNGCESSLATDPEHCGACGNSCGVGGVCTAGVCDRVIDVQAGNDFTCAIRSGRRGVVCWGANTYGQRGDGTFTGGYIPSEVLGLSGVLQLGASAGSGDMSGDVTDFTCARTEALIFCWGGGRFGQLGTGVSLATRSEPGTVAGVPTIDLGRADVRDVAVGGWHACAFQEPIVGGTTQEELYCWGRNTLGSIISSGGAASYSTAVHVFERLNSTPIIMGLGMRHTCYYTENAGAMVTPRLVCQGYAGVSGTFTDARYAQLDGGEDFECGVTTTGTVRCWGENGARQLGLGDTTDRAAPTDVPGLTNIVQVAAGGNRACARRADGRVLCWGTAPVGTRIVSSGTPVLIAGLTDVVDVTVGLRHACAVDSTGDVYCWGDNNFGALGLPPAFGNTPTPTLVPTL